MKKIIYFFILLFFIFTPECYSEDVKVINYKLQENMEIKGVYNEFNMNFYVNDHWIVSDNSYVYINLNISEMIKYPSSSLTIYLNNSPIGTINLFGTKNIQTAVPIPSKKVKKGFNTLSFKVFKVINKEDCLDFINPANWVEFLEDSYIHLEYLDENKNITLRDFPYPFLKKGQDIPVDALILTSRSLDDINAVLYLSSIFGKYEPYSNLDINIKFMDEFNNEDKNIIVISDYNKLNDRFKAYITEYEKKELNNKALIKLIPSPNGKYILLITSLNSKKIIEAVKVLGYEEYLEGLKGTSTLFEGYKMDYNTTLSDTLTLMDLGYDDFVLNNQNEAVFSIGIPKEYELKDDAYLELKYRYSNMLDFKSSYLTVFINGRPYLDKPLSAEKSLGDSLKISLKEFKNNSYIEVKVKFNLYPREKNCIDYYNNRLFAVLLNSSIFYIPKEYKTRRDLIYYPAPFVEGYSLNNLNLVLPKNITSRELKYLCNIFSYLGHSMKVIDNLTVSSQLDENRNNFVYINSGEEIKLSSLNKEVYEMLMGLKQNESAFSLFDNRGSFLAVLKSVNSENIKNIGIYLSNFDSTPRLKGQICIVDENGRLRYYEVKDSFSEAKKSLDRENLAKIFFILSLIDLILLIFIEIKQNK
ncbi:cellulose biosynthesis cyclic di-GMP-binding regulatory protein BcsB [Thermobrachium celere]|uniref:cellulose biosynthesis cyclic di-GMP-binding regulatory protein BcsB n=1 Tax=Thermobrachium celere TaxID=53422 RepID=UPI001944BF4F|nr:cellulose biosynthesis cyclic di-GMP-binding regulatory protein BcsB [Thermobrachium celere]GFR36306.1 hypothetical protein TCEA9_21180 [Thermobrachium celere]